MAAIWKVFINVIGNYRGKMKITTEDFEKYRMYEGITPFGKPETHDGAFEIPFESYLLRIICSDGMGWDHVSVSLHHRCPSWKEMCFIKDLFFNDNETVIQFHPKKTEYVNYHPYCLHLWRNHYEEVELPPSIMVGPKCDKEKS